MKSILVKDSRQTGNGFIRPISDGPSVSLVASGAKVDPTICTTCPKYLRLSPKTTDFLIATITI